MTTDHSTEPCSALIEELSPALFRALADPTRARLIVALADGGGERTVGEVAAAFPQDLSVVSRHLRVLRDAGAAESHRRGKQVYYRIRARELAEFFRSLADALMGCCSSPKEGGDRR